MIIAQLPSSNIASLSYGTVATIQAFQASANATAAGVAAGAIALPVGQGFNFGVPFHVLMGGNVVSFTTGRTVTLGFTAFVGPTAPAASPTLTTTMNAPASASLTASSTNVYPFFVDYELMIDATSNKLIGTVSGAFGIAASLLDIAQVGPVTGFALPAAATPYSWTSPITGLVQPSNAPFMYLVPQSTESGTDVSSSVNLSSFVVTQG